MKRRICCRSTHNITIPGCRFDGVGLSREDAALPAMQLKDDPPVCCQDDSEQHACSKAPRRIYNCRKKRIKAVRSSSKPSLRVVSRRPASRDLKKNEHKKKSSYSSTLGECREDHRRLTLRPLPDLQHRQSLGLQIAVLKGLGFVTPEHLTKKLVISFSIF
jgi:hypothetical protein